jgi:putative flippase GtrA
MCLKFVFSSAKNGLGKSTKDKFLFLIIGILGLGMSELGMFIGVSLLKIAYPIVKVIIAGVVMIWNYLARKFFIFNLRLIKQDYANMPLQKVVK